MIQAYIEVRSEGESLLRSSGIPATIVRPWYVLGPAHWWPVFLGADVLDLRSCPGDAGFREKIGPGNHWANVGGAGLGGGRCSFDNSNC